MTVELGRDYHHQAGKENHRCNGAAHFASAVPSLSEDEEESTYRQNYYYFYETYQKDAEKASKILGITLTISSKTKDQDGKPLAMAGFPYHALDTYLPKLIRAGERVSICDQIEAPKQTTKRGITELVEGKKEQEQLTAKEAPKEETQETRSHSFHR